MKTIAKENIPGRREFKSRFNRKLGATAQLFDPISEQLAEEAESLLMDVWLNQFKEKTVFVTRRNKTSKQNHYCSNCQKSQIYPTHKFCPVCGMRVVWNELKKAI
jgi:uncharacterized paraquat-inducible protein A